MARKELEQWFWQVDASLQRLTETITQSGPRFANSTCWLPRVDLTESPTRFVLTVELAGVRPEDVLVVYLPDRHSILVKGSRQERPRDEEHGGTTGALVLEIFYGEFEREVRLPDAPIEPQSMESELENGILFVILPKARTRLAHKRITVRKV
jgi:HSP20 family molecular chaperone IbpA